MILIALANGFLIIVSRIFNARLGKVIGPAGASVWNHLSASFLLGLIVIFLRNEHFHFQDIPVYAYLGGIIGACYVTISNFLIPRVGTSKATILMIAGQIGLATFIDYLRNSDLNLLFAILGIALIIFGIIIAEREKESCNQNRELRNLPFSKLRKQQFKKYGA